MSETESALITKRIALLAEFQEALSRYHNAQDSEQRSNLRTFLNRNMVAVRVAVREAGTQNLMTIAPPSAVGGVVSTNLDPLQNLFRDFYGFSLVRDALDSIQQAIGVYEHLLEGSGLVKLPSQQAIDIEAAVERALRPSFKDPPKDERAVQDALEIIFQSIGIEYTREREVAPVGAKAFKPDFVVPSDDLAVEVKFARPGGRSLAELQEELTADVAAYRTKWKRLLVVIYDCGIIVDPYAFRKLNMTLFGVSMSIVKH